MVNNGWDGLMSISQCLLLGSNSNKFWYLVPLIVVISLVYGGTRHETLTQILTHSIRSAVWLILFLFFIFVVIWLSGFGTTADLLTPWDVQLLLAVLAWVFGAMWIAGNVFPHNAYLGWGCLLTGGGMALAIGLKQCWSQIARQKAGISVSQELDTSESDSRFGNRDRQAAAHQVAPMWFPVIVMVGALVWGAIAWFSR